MLYVYNLANQSVLQYESIGLEPCQSSKGLFPHLTSESAMLSEMEFLKHTYFKSAKTGEERRENERKKCIFKFQKQRKQ